MRIGIGFFGLPRNTDLTFSSIQEHILEPAACLGTVLTRFHLYQQTHVVNPRSNEDAEITQQQYLPFEAFEGELQSPEGVAEHHGFASLSARGDAWGDDNRSLRNLLLQLHSLHNVTCQLERLSPDVVIFVRPDLRYHHSFEAGLRDMLVNNDHVVRLPFWQWAGGYNDRFAICGRNAFIAYGKRLEQTCLYLNKYPNRPLHSERLLRFALDKQNISVRRLDVQASRVRVNGEEVREDFSRVQANRLIRWRAREIRKAISYMLHH